MLPWRSRRGDPPPFVFIFALASDSRADIISFLNSWNEGRWPGISAKDVEVEFSTKSPDAGYDRVGFFHLERERTRQEFRIARSDVRWIRLTIHSNYGHPDLTELNKFSIYGKINFHTPLIISSFIWIVGVAIILAAFGWHQHLARRENLTLRDTLRLTTFTNPAKLGAVLIAAGVLASVVGEPARVPVLATLASTGFIAATVIFFKSWVKKTTL
ncbi:MAG: hypothetical protein SCM96_15825 [Acidobacteriota bacterium]|nr:hypothetical protein [Acidobacteriota bacterium]